jgi:hypothetical protein
VSCLLAVITATAGYRKWLLDARFPRWRALLAPLLMEDRDFADSVSDSADSHLITQCRYREVEIAVNLITFVF